MQLCNFLKPKHSSCFLRTQSDSKPRSHLQISTTKPAHFPSSGASGSASAAVRAHLKMTVVEEEVVVVVQTQPQEEEEEE